MKATHNPPTDVEISPADLLRMTAVYIQRHGWNQGDYYSPIFDAATPPACVSGALGMACFGAPIGVPPIHEPGRTEYHRGLMVLADHLGVSTVAAVFNWNDTPGRTKAEILDALNAAAEAWDALHTQGGENS
jgi:hypothetical protein